MASLFDESNIFETLDCSAEVSVLAQFDPLRSSRKRKEPESAAAPLSPTSAALSGQPSTSRDGRKLPHSPSRRGYSGDGLLVDLGTPTASPPVRQRLSASPSRTGEKTPLQSPSRTPQTARKADTPSKRPPLLSVRSPTHSTLRSPPKIKAPASSQHWQQNIFADVGNTTTLPNFALDASLIADEAGSFLVDQTMGLTDDFSRLFVAPPVAKGNGKDVGQGDADDTLADDWFQTSEADTRAIMDESTLMTGNMTITAELHPPPRTRTLSAAPSPAPASPSRLTRTTTLEPLSGGTVSSPKRESPLKNVQLRSGAARAAAASLWSGHDAAPKPPRQPLFAAAPAARRMGGLETPRATRVTPLPSSASRGGLAAPDSLKKTKSSTSLAMRAAALPRPSSAFAVPRTAAGMRTGAALPTRPAPRMSSIPAPASMTGLKPLNLPPSRAPTSVPMQREISRPVAPASGVRPRPLSLAGGPTAGLKRSLGPSRSEPMAAPRMPRSQSDANLVRASNARLGHRSSISVGERPVRRA